jgi:hypothetical protein
MRGFGTNDQLLTEIVCTRTNAEIMAAKIAFQAKLGKTLEEWIEGDTSGMYAQFLLACLQVYIYIYILNR